MTREKLIIATNNQGKVREIKEIFKGEFLNIVSLKDENLDIDVVEDGQTFMENALKKANAVYEATKVPSLADDSGICVDALNGAPGIFSARFAGEYATDEENNQKLIALMKDVPEDKRGAKYVCAVVLKIDEETIITAYGELKGKIICDARGTNGFGYDPYFYLEEYGQTTAQIPPELKNKISHRGRALKNLREKLL
ncbi:MAG: XTP/dITP diphosphatase [Eubacteriales bacterium]